MLITKHEHHKRRQETENKKLQNSTDQHKSNYTDIRNEIHMYKLCDKYQAYTSLSNR